jgi:small subunit ribosomal protein S15
MSIKNKEHNAKIIADFKSSDKDNGGSVEVQVALLTTRINNLTQHIKINKKDEHGKHGLLLMVNHRKKLLAYIKGRSVSEYEDLIKKLGLRK